MDLGNIAHQALERFAHKIEEEGLDWVTMPEEKREQLIDESVKKVFWIMEIQFYSRLHVMSI